MTESFKTTISSMVRKTNEIRDKTYYFSEIVPFVDGQITTNIPRMGVVGAILSSTIETEAELLSLQNKFIKIKRDCHKLESQLFKYQGDVQNILNTTNLIRTRLNNLYSLINTLSQTVPFIRNIVRLARGIIALQVSVPVAGGNVSGALIIKQKEIIDRVLAKLEEILALQKVFNSVAGPLIVVAEEVDEILIPVSNKLSELGVILAARCRDIDLLLLQVLAQSNVNNDPNLVVTSDGTPTFNIISNFDIERVIDNLEISSKPKFIEYLRENGNTGYQITKN